MKYSKTLGSVALSALLLLGVSGCNSSSSSSDPVAEVGETPITPYTRVAVIEGADWGAFDGNGAIVDPTVIDVHSIADKIAKYVVRTNEAEALNFPSNWVIAGANPDAEPAEDYTFSDLLPIPVPTAEGTKKSRVIEFCNKAYAKEAVGTGKFHGSALPCEVSVHSENGNVYVDMLDAEAIFNIFFTDAKDNPDYTEQDLIDFASMATEVKSELRQMIIAALSDPATGVTETDPISNTELHDELGPEFTQDKIDNDIAFRSPYIVYKYSGVGTGPDNSFILADANALATSIITALGTDDDNASNRIPGLSAGSAWRSGREFPISIPYVKVVEACSPKYAKKATVLGNEYITALPCEFTVYVDETDDNNQTLAISFLNPNFMFGTMFEGAVGNKFDPVTDKDTIIEYSTLADVVFADLRMIVDFAVQDRFQNEGEKHNLGLVIK